LIHIGAVSAQGALVEPATVLPLTDPYCLSPAVSSQPSPASDDVAGLGWDGLGWVRPSARDQQMKTLSFRAPGRVVTAAVVGVAVTDST
jgi:hypothetical protein